MGRMSDQAFSPVRIATRPPAEGEAVKFVVRLHGLAREAFAVRWKGAVHAYLNTCRHQSLPLDFGDAHFFDDAYDALVCVQHGARYAPDSGACVDGPCEGGRLTRLRLEERADGLWCVGLGTMG